ncbi:MAG: S1 RNA-binding domain-containing protein [Candidatus Nomurabacteria bacterium]|jgi:small subunit ribosomal protein S1|nr:S1 RNA-binding domain-containing protein [Candidatus Nomurabacteria bacterium]
MDELLAGQDFKAFEEGELVNGKVLSVKKSEILVDLGAHGVGIIPRNEVAFSRNLKVGEEVQASILGEETEDGYQLVSFRKAAKDRGWDELLAKKASGEVIEVTPFDVNRGGLLIEFNGVRGFMPVSQLAVEHYPRAAAGDRSEIIQKLSSLIGKPLTVKVIDVDKKNNKLIFSERDIAKTQNAEKLEGITVGSEVDGVVSGIVDFGAFVNVGGIEGLVHISEVSWERVLDVSKYLKVGDEVHAKVISVDNGRLSLSIKQTLPDPWLSETAHLKKGDEVEGTITRITPFGAFVQITPSVEALVHITEMGSGKNNAPEKVFALGDKKKFTVIDIDLPARKIALSLKK